MGSPRQVPGHWEWCARTLCTLLAMSAYSDAWNRMVTDSTSGRCPGTWTESGGSCYKVFIFKQPLEATSSFINKSATRDRGWKRAKLSCLVQGSDLVSINTAREAYRVDVIRRKRGVDDTHFYWVGLTDAGTEGSFRWVDGSNVTFSRWKVGEPTSSIPQNPRAQDEDYVVALGNSQWMDVADGWTSITSGCLEPYAYICEKALTSSSKSAADKETVGRRISRILGLVGSAGATGRVGVKGDRGPAGVPGMPGRRGKDGINGKSGVQGEKGERGEAGLIGATGARGPHGLPGKIQVLETLIGPDGARGVTGPRGPTGEPGRRGPAGLTGPGGEKGEKGSTGQRGANGRRGDRGKAGLQGQRGRIGPHGSTGGRGLTGRPGPRGKLGPAGAAGTPGAKGNKGDRGFDGLRGMMGPNGLIGPRGPAGVQGLTGRPGFKGEVGRKGSRGRKGDNGTRGLKGNQGEIGIPGLDGAVGATGNVGPEGPIGHKGKDGRSGRNGIPGMPGLGGLHGPKGSPGKSGPRGHVGPPGPPGPVPANLAMAVDGASLDPVIGAPQKIIFVNATAFCRGRVTGAYSHPLHCWQFITCGALYGGDMEHTCYSGRRFEVFGPECKKDHTCVFGAPSVQDDDFNQLPEKKNVAALVLEEGDTRFARRSLVEKLRATHSVYSAGMVVIFVLLAALVVLVLRLHLTRGRHVMPPLVLEKPVSVI